MLYNKLTQVTIGQSNKVSGGSWALRYMMALLTSVTMQGGSRQTPMNSTTLGCRIADMIATCIQDQAQPHVLSSSNSMHAFDKCLLATHSMPLKQVGLLCNGKKT